MRRVYVKHSRLTPLGELKFGEEFKFTYLDDNGAFVQNTAIPNTWVFRGNVNRTQSEISIKGESKKHRSFQNQLVYKLN